MDDRSYYRATSIAQMLLAEQVSELAPDGKWGKFTQAAYDRVTPLLRSRVDLMLRTLVPPTSAKELAAFREAQRPKQAVTSLASSDVSGIRAMISSLAREEGVPVDLALKVAKLESNFNPKAKSPTGALGLFQLTSAAVKDVSEKSGYKPTDLMDPIQNTRTGLKYLKIVARYMKRPLTDYAEIYMGYNIGSGAAQYVLNGKPELAAKYISQQAYGKPSVYAANVRTAIAQA